MPYMNAPLVAFNRGVISPLALCRTDFKRTAMSAEIQENWVPRVLGSMALRVGLGYTGASHNNAKSITLPFIYSGDDYARMELTDSILRVLIADTPITRPSVTSALGNSFAAYVTNGTFDTDTAWTKGAGWTISAGVANAGPTISTALSQNSAVTLVNGKSYSLTYTVTRSAGTITPAIGGTSGTGRTASGTYTETIVAGATQAIAFTGTGFTGTVDNVIINPINTGWMDQDESGATSTLSGSYLSLVGTDNAAAIREQEVTVSGGNIGVEHALRIVVERGPVTLRVGSATGTENYIRETIIGTGTHSLAFTPTGNFFIQLRSITIAEKRVTSVAVEGAGIMTLPTPWLLADLPTIRWDASADVTYLSCYGYQQRKIERRASRSWSVVLYEPTDGPFRNPNLTPTTMTPSAINGDITLTASRKYFMSTNVGSLMKLTSVGQLVTASLSGENQFTNPIKVIGTGTQRSFDVICSGTWSGTLQLQRSVGAPGAWVDVVGRTYTTNGTTAYQDFLNDQEIYYRVGFKTGDYTSGTAVVSLSYDSGSITGVVKITGYTSETVVTAAVLEDLGNTSGSAEWAEGEWSDRRGWPAEVKLHEGRLFNIGKSKVQGSISDAYESFDYTQIGDAAAINRSFGKGPVDKALWAISLQRLLIGGAMAEWSVRSNSFDEPLTAANFNVRSPSSQGSASVPAIQIDDRALFVQKGGSKLYQLSYAESTLIDYQSSDLCELAPEICQPSIVRIVVQRQPDTRVHCVLSDGTVAVLISQPAEDTTCWIKVTTGGASGFVEDAVVLPGAIEDQVYYTVKRTVNGGTVRYHEKWALESECIGGQLNKIADSFVTYTGVASATITAAHLKGETVVIWADGKDLGTAVADIGTGVVTLPGGVTATNIMVGKAYDALFKSSKLAYAAAQGTALTMTKKVHHLGLVLYNTHYQGLKYGRDFNNLQNLPLTYKGKVTPADTIHSTYDTDPVWFAGEWDTDSRLCLKASAPRPCNVLGAIIGMQTNG